MATILGCQAEHKKHMKELEEARTEFNQEVDRITEETEARVRLLTTTCNLLTAQLRLELNQAKEENLALQEMHDSREEHINILVMKQRQKLNRKIDETLTVGWKQWLTQAAELQVLWVDTENRRKDGKGFYKLDKNSINMVWNDLAEDFHALADGHTKAISTLMEEFNIDQIMLRIETDQALNVKLPVDDEGPTKSEISTSPKVQNNEQMVEGSSDIQPDPMTVTEQVEGILHILTED